MAADKMKDAQKLAKEQAEKADDGMDKAKAEGEGMVGSTSEHLDVGI